MFGVCQRPLCILRWSCLSVFFFFGLFFERRCAKACTWREPLLSGTALPTIPRQQYEGAPDFTPSQQNVSKDDKTEQMATKAGLNGNCLTGMKVRLSPDSERGVKRKLSHRETNSEADWKLFRRLVKILHKHLILWNVIFIHTFVYLLFFLTTMCFCNSREKNKESNRSNSCPKCEIVLFLSVNEKAFVSTTRFLPLDQILHSWASWPLCMRSVYAQPASAFAHCRGVQCFQTEGFQRHSGGRSCSKSTSKWWTCFMQIFTLLFLNHQENWYK